MSYQHFRFCPCWGFGR